MPFNTFQYIMLVNKVFRIPLNSCHIGHSPFSFYYGVLKSTKLLCHYEVVWDTFILNYLWDLSVLEIDKWTHHYKPRLWPKFIYKFMYMQKVKHIKKLPIWCKILIFDKKNIAFIKLYIWIPFQIIQKTFDMRNIIIHRENLPC